MSDLEKLKDAINLTVDKIDGDLSAAILSIETLVEQYPVGPWLENVFADMTDNLEKMKSQFDPCRPMTQDEMDKWENEPDDTEPQIVQ